MSDPERYAQLLGAPSLRHYTLLVPRWPGEGERLKGLTLTLYECDFAEGADPKDLKQEVQPSEKDLVARLRFDLLRNPEHENDPLQPAWIVHDAQLQDGKRWRTKSKLKPQQADLSVVLGQRTFHLAVPAEDDYLDEGRWYEIGWELADEAGGAFSRVSNKGCVLVEAPQPLTKMLRLAETPRGALVRKPDAKRSRRPDPVVPPDEPMGRFSDPARVPPVKPQGLEPGALDGVLLTVASAGGEVDLDGLRFEQVLAKGEQRRAWIEWFAANNPTIKAARAIAHEDYPLHTKDITKAYFVIHDVGIKAAPRAPDHYTGAKVKGEFVHGFLNFGGTFAVSRDFSSPKGPGTMGELIETRDWLHAYGIAIETVPFVVERDKMAKAERRRGKRGWWKGAATWDPDLRGEVVCVGHDGTFDYHWTAALLDALADLYLFASARAGHLLTVTTHLELDRNLSFGYLFFERTNKEIKGKLRYNEARVRDGAKDLHTDPFGLDLSHLYSRITARLNDAAQRLGRFPVPARARYGIHPRRVVGPDGARLGDTSGDHHTFPYQSNPEVAQLSRADRSQVRVWSASMKARYGDDPRRPGRKKVVGWERPPFWEKD